MHTLTKPRAEPYVWVTWLTKLLAGESSCVWSAWLRAHHQTARMQTDLDLETWQMDHSALLRQTGTELASKGYKVHIEGQNLFTLKGRIGTLAGKPDVVAVKGSEGWILDTKTGSPKASHRIQVMLYLWAFPQTNPAFAGVRFEGKVIYRTRYNIVTLDEVDVNFKTRVTELLREVCGETEPHKAPSFRECLFCPVTPEDCGDRIKKEAVYVGETEEF